MAHEQIDLPREGLSLLTYVEELIRAGAHSVHAQQLRDAYPLPHLSTDDVEYVLRFLSDLEYLKRHGFYGETRYEMTALGKSKVWHHRTSGKAQLEFPDPDCSGPTISIGQGASGPVQAPVHTGTGHIHATQTNHMGEAQQAEVRQLLGQLTEILERLAPSTERDAATIIVRAATESAQQGAWEAVGQRLMSVLTFLALLASLTADGAQALEIGRRALDVLSGGT